MDVHWVHSKHAMCNVMTGPAASRAQCNDCIHVHVRRQSDRSAALQQSYACNLLYSDKGPVSSKYCTNNGVCKRLAESANAVAWQLACCTKLDMVSERSSREIG